MERGGRGGGCFADAAFAAEEEITRGFERERGRVAADVRRGFSAALSFASPPLQRSFPFARLPEPARVVAAHLDLDGRRLGRVNLLHQLKLPLFDRAQTREQFR